MSCDCVWCLHLGPLDREPTVEEIQAGANKLLEAVRARLPKPATPDERAAWSLETQLAKMVFAAYDRCPCGAGIAYWRNPGPDERHWDCASIMLGEAIPQGQTGSVQHTDRKPFVFWKVLSEQQPSAGGATTRPAFSYDAEGRLHLWLRGDAADSWTPPTVGRAQPTAADGSPQGGR